MNYQGTTIYALKRSTNYYLPLRSWKNSLLPKMLQTPLHMLAKAIHQILKGDDDRLLVVIGPCSIHDPAAAKSMPPAC